ncbi:MAG: hypothetical protein ACR2PG_06310 [Hyphomicrobiaceae bacterium]
MPSIVAATMRLILVTWCVFVGSILVLSVMLFGYEYNRLTRAFPPQWDVRTQVRYVSYNINDKLEGELDVQQRIEFVQLNEQRQSYVQALDEHESCLLVHCEPERLERAAQNIAAWQTDRIPN